MPQLSTTSVIAVNIPKFDFSNLPLLLSGKLSIQDYLFVAIQLLDLLGPGGGKINIFGAAPGQLPPEQEEFVRRLEEELDKLSIVMQAQPALPGLGGYEAPGTQPGEIKQFNPLLVIPIIQAIMELMRLFRR